MKKANKAEDWQLLLRLPTNHQREVVIYYSHSEQPISSQEIEAVRDYLAIAAKHVAPPVERCPSRHQTFQCALPIGHNTVHRYKDLGWWNEKEEGKPAPPLEQMSGEDYEAFRKVAG
jgi:hypothetical protein